MFGFGTTEVILVIATLILFFGAKKISTMAREIGEAVKHIRGGFSNDNNNKDKGTT